MDNEYYQKEKSKNENNFSAGSVISHVSSLGMSLLRKVFSFRKYQAVKSNESGYFMYSVGNHLDAAKKYEQSIRNGSVDAYFNLGWLCFRYPDFDKGISVENQLLKSAEYFDKFIKKLNTKAAFSEQKLTEAENKYIGIAYYILGIMAEQGIGGKPDFSKAMQNYYEGAQYSFSLCYRKIADNLRKNPSKDYDQIRKMASMAYELSEDEKKHESEQYYSCIDFLKNTYGHDFEKETFPKDKTFVIKDKNGEEEQVQVISAFEFKDTKKEYVVFTKNEIDDKGNTIVYVSEVDRSSGEPTLQRVDDEDWSRVRKVLRELATDGDGNGSESRIEYDEDGMEII